MSQSVPRQIQTKLHQIPGRIEDFFFPPLCIICDTPRISSNKWFCLQCYTHILNNHKERDCCPRCSQNNKYRTCTCEIIWEYPFESIYSFLDYDEIVQKIMQHIKYFNKKSLAFYMGKLMAEIAPSEIFTASDLVTAVPLHWLRKLHRGYNQAEWFARGMVSRHKNLKLLERGLVRIRRTKTQVKLDRTDRTTNVKGAFKYKEQFSEHLRGKSILLIDDVITTGATTASCAEALLAGGCKRVKVLSLARD